MTAVRIVYALLAVSLCLFVFGVWFILVAARQGGGTSAAPPVASVRELMDGIVTPASNAVYAAVSTTVTKDGVQEVAPANDREWQRVGGHAAALAEVGRLLMVDGRARDTADWMTLSQALVDSALQARTATEKKDADALLAAGEVLNNSCDNCHRRYQVEIE